MKWIILRTFDISTEAYLLRATLVNEGIHSVIEDEQIVSVDPICAIGVGSIK